MCPGPEAAVVTGYTWATTNFMLVTSAGTQLHAYVSDLLRSTLGFPGGSECGKLWSLTRCTQIRHCKDKAHAPYGVDLQPERRADGCVFIPLSPGSKTLRRLFSGFSEEPCEVRQSGALHALHLCVARLFLASLPVSLTSALWSCHP